MCMAHCLKGFPRMNVSPESISDSNCEPGLDSLYSAASYAKLRNLLGDAACLQLGFFAIPDDFTLSVVIPVYNERETLETLIERVKAVPIQKEIILVDDGSTDGTQEKLHRLNGYRDSHNRIAVHFHEKNRGKGAALRTGFLQTTGDVVLVQDADLEYSPNEYPRLLLPILRDEADVVFGSRFLGDQPHRVLYFWHYVGNKVITMLSNCFTNLNFTDIETCYKVFRGNIIREIAPQLQQERFGIEPELTSRMSRGGWRVFEVSISYHGRTYAQGKKIGWRDGIQAIWCIVRYGLGK